jgi:hypothetical protein
MKDLLKEAIADAKAVKQTALANAKIALEEAFTPRLQSMLSAKLAEEMDDETDEQPGDEHEEAPIAAPEEGEQGHDEHEGGEETGMEGETDEHDGMQDEGYDEEGAPEHSEEGQDDDLDLDEIIKELEMDENEHSSDIGNGGQPDYESADDEINDDLFEEGEDVPSEEDGTEHSESDGDEDIDINEIIKSLREEDGGEDEKEPKDSEELEEAYNVIRFLKGKINEVNLLNAKLLYSNKLFRNFSLNEGQKMKVIENFDRTHNLREVKLVYATLAEGFKMPSPKKVVRESFASKPVASTKPAKQVISEGADLAARFKKLAGLK